MNTHIFEKDNVLNVCLYIQTLGAGGAERQIVTLARELRSQGVNVRVVCDKLAGADGHYLPSLSELGIAATTFNNEDNFIRGARLLKQFYSRFAPMTQLPLKHETVVTLAGEFARLPPDILHCYLDAANATGGCAGMLAGVPGIILSGRSLCPTNHPEYPRLKWTKPVYDFLLQHHRVTLEANSTIGARNYAEWLDIAPERIKISPNGIDVSAYQPPNPNDRDILRRELNIDHAAPVVAYVARLTEVKNPIDLLQIALLAREKLPNIKFLIIGEEMEMTQKVKQFISRYRLNQTTLILGRRNDINNIFFASDATILTSRIEGMPNAIVEGMLAGLPVVATRVGAIPDLIQQGVNGFVHEVGDIQGMCNSLLRLLINKKMAKLMGENNRARVIDNFSSQHLGNRAMNLYYNSIQKNA